MAFSSTLGCAGCELEHPQSSLFTILIFRYQLHFSFLFQLYLILVWTNCFERHFSRFDSESFAMSLRRY